jgi:hypothetical protein
LFFWSYKKLEIFLTMEKSLLFFSAIFLLIISCKKDDRQPLKQMNCSVISNLTSDFRLSASSSSSHSNYFTITAEVDTIPSNSIYYWEVVEIDAIGNEIPGTKMSNHASWQTKSTTFPHYYNSQTGSETNGLFSVGHIYEVTRYVAGKDRFFDCNTWEKSSAYVAID